MGGLPFVPNAGRLPGKILYYLQAQYLKEGETVVVNVTVNDPTDI